jgi:hypothetical protein
MEEEDWRHIARALKKARQEGSAGKPPMTPDEMFYALLHALFESLEDVDPLFDREWFLAHALGAAWAA